jgi:hypothetical protein
MFSLYNVLSTVTAACWCLLLHQQANFACHSRLVLVAMVVVVLGAISAARVCCVLLACLPVFFIDPSYFLAAPAAAHSSYTKLLLVDVQSLFCCWGFCLAWPCTISCSAAALLSSTTAFSILSPLCMIL